MSEIEKSRVNDTSHIREFDQESNIGIFRDVILKNYQEIPEELIAYRTVKDLPLKDDDQLPLIVRNQRDGKNRVSRGRAEEELLQLSEYKKMKAVGHYALSINNSADNCEKSAITTFKKLVEKGVSEEELQAYIDQRGEYIAKFHLRLETGLVTEFNDTGHGNLLLYKDVILEEYRDKEFIHKINYRGPSDEE